MSRNLRSTPSVLALATLIGALFTCCYSAFAASTILHVDAAPLSKVVPIAAKQHLEACAPAGSGKPYRWRFAASDPLDFNVHFHATVAASDGTKKEVVEYPVKLDAIRQHEGAFTTQNSHVHCWMWSNRGSRPVQLTFTIEPR